MLIESRRKQIDEVCRILANYIETGYSDTRLTDKLICFIYSVENIGLVDELDENEAVTYFIQSLKRELKSPEVIQRDKIWEFFGDEFQFMRERGIINE